MHKLSQNRCGSGVCMWLSCALSSWCPVRLQPRCLPRPLYVKPQKKYPIPCSCLYWKFQFLLSCWTESHFLSDYLPEITLGPLSHGLLHVSARFIKVSNGELASKMEVTILWNLITEVTSYHFCYILLVKSIHSK